MITKNDKFVFDADASNSITVDTKFADASGDKVGVMMGDGACSRCAFMIPNPDVTSLKVKVVTAESKTMTKNLNMNSFKPKQIHFVKLRRLTLKI